jgi:hypothetical protein
MKGTITNVNIGPLVIEGVLGDDGNLYVSAQQVASLFGATPNNATYYLKAALGEGLMLLKISVKIDGDKTRQNNCIALSDFERVLRYYDKKGNPQAEQLAEALIGLSLTQLFSDAFGLKFEGDDRRKYLELRMKSKGARRSFTDEAQLYYRAKHGKDPSGPYYAALTNKVYQKLFGETAEELKTKFKVPKGKLLRDFLPEKMLHQVEASETMLCRWLDNGLSPDEAMDRL